MLDIKKFKIKIVKRHYYGDDNRLRGQDLFDVYLNVGLFPPIFNRWVVNRKGLTMHDLQFYIHSILHECKELTIKF